MPDNQYGWCWLGIHSWTAWTDKGVYKESRHYSDNVKIPCGEFTKQERRCKLCNKLNHRREYL